MIKFIEIRILHHKFKKKIDELGFGFIKKEIIQQQSLQFDEVPFKVLKKIMYDIDRYCDKYVANNRCLYRSLIAKYMLKKRGYNVILCNGFDKKNKIFHTWLEDKNGKTIFENGRKYERIM